MVQNVPKWILSNTTHDHHYNNYVWYTIAIHYIIWNVDIAIAAVNQYEPGHQHQAMHDSIHGR